MGERPAIGRLIRRGRIEMDMSQRRFAELMGFSHVFVSQIETGKASLPAKHWSRAAEVLAIPLDEIAEAARRTPSAEYRAGWRDCARRLREAIQSVEEEVTHG